MKTKNLAFFAGAALSLAASQMANAFTISSVVGGVPSGVNYVTFDSLPLGTAGGVANNTAGSLNPSGSVTVTITSDGQVVTGSSSGLYAAPFLSNNQGANFDGQPDGADATRYLTSGDTASPSGSVTVDFGSVQKYVGLLWGSVDLYNTLSFYNGNTLVGTITGGQVNAAANGNQGASGTYYVNINAGAGEEFTKIVATSSNFAFEFDNVAYNAENVSVPDGGSLLAALGFSFVGLAAANRRLKSK